MSLHKSYVARPGPLHIHVIILPGVIAIAGQDSTCNSLAHRNRSDFCDLRLRCPSRTPEIARFPRQEKAMLHCDLRVRWKVASDLRFRAAISESKTPSFCGISGDLAPSTSRAAKRGGFKRGGFPIWTCPSFFVLFCPFGTFPGIFPICPGTLRGFPRLVLFLFLGLLSAPTRNSPERVRDTIWTIPEKVGNTRVWKPPGLASLNNGPPPDGFPL